nr:hypothetical protein [Tanacetum cinerariifolium]
MNEDQARPDPRESRAALAGPNPEPTHDDFMANVYPNVHESLKFLADEHVIIEEPLIIDLSQPKPVSPTTQAPIFTATTATTTTTLPLPPPPQQQSTTDSELAARVTALEKKFADFEQKSQTLDNTTRNLRSMVFTLELRDLPHKINQTVNEVVKKAVHIAFEASLRDHFRELPEADMKEILHQWMFESGSYKSLHAHIALYEALEASMERANKDEFFVENGKSRKRRRHDQDPPPPPPDSDPTWKMSDTREAPSSSSKQQSGPYSEQPVKDVPMPDTALMSDSEDIDSARLLKIKPRPECSYQDPKEYKLLRQTGDMSSFINWFCKRIGKKKLSKADLEGPAFK